MSFRRYLIAVDTSRPTAALDRYLAPMLSMLPATEAKLARYRSLEAQNPGVDPNSAAIIEALSDSVSQLRALQQRLAATDYFAPSAWAAADADEVQNATATSLPERLRTFLASPHASTDQIVHYADRDGALAAIRRAAAVTPAQIAAMPTAAAQSEATTAMARNFAEYFRRMNLRPWAWRRYGARLVACFGLASTTPRTTGRSVGGMIASEFGAYGEALATWVGALGGLQRSRPSSTSSAAYNNTVFGPQGYERLLTQRPYPQDSFGGIGGVGTPELRDVGGSTLANDWRTEAWTRCRARLGADVTSGGPSNVRFGSPSAVASARRDQNACAAINLAQTQGEANACVGPSNDVYRIWLTNAGLLGGGMNYDPSCYTTSSCYEAIDCVRRSLRDGTTTGPSQITAPAGPNWLCGGASSDDDFVYYVPPDLWYVLFLWPMIQYLASRDPLEIVYEVMLDVAGKNTWTALATGNGERALGGLVENRPQGMDARASLLSIQNGLGTAAAIGGTANPVFGAIAGFGAASAGLAAQLIPPRETGSFDELGRREPVIEYLPIIANSRPNYRADVLRQLGFSDTAMPTLYSPITYHGNEARFVPPPQRAQSLSWIEDPSTIAAQAGSRSQSPGESSMKFAEPDEAIVRIVGMPQGGGVYLDGASTPIDGQWEAGTDATVWVVPVPYGTHSLAVRSPDGQVRAARVSLNSGQTLTGEFATMQPVVPEPPRGSAGMSGAAKAGVAVLAIGAIGGGAYVFRKKLGLESFFRGVTGKR